MADNDDYSRLVETAQSDEGVLGLVLTGSRGRGVFVSPASDWDVRLVVRDDDLAACVERFATPHGSPVEVAVFSLSSFEQAGAIGSPNEWDRYSYAHADVVLDELGGQIGALVTEKGLLPPVAAREIAERPGHLHQLLLPLCEEPAERSCGRGSVGCCRVDLAVFDRTVCDARAGSPVQQVPLLGVGGVPARRRNVERAKTSRHGSRRSLLPGPSASSSVYFGKRSTSRATGDLAMSWMDGSLTFSGSVVRLNSLD
jgi:hypothetical protein